MFREALHFAPVYLHWRSIVNIGLQLERVGSAVVVEVLHDDSARGASHLNQGPRLDMDRVDNLLRIFDHHIRVHCVMCSKDYLSLCAVCGLNNQVSKLIVCKYFLIYLALALSIVC